MHSISHKHQIFVACVIQLSYWAFTIDFIIMTWILWEIFFKTMRFTTRCFSNNSIFEEIRRCIERCEINYWLITILSFNCETRRLEIFWKIFHDWHFANISKFLISHDDFVDFLFMQFDFDKFKRYVNRMR